MTAKRRDDERIKMTPKQKAFAEHYAATGNGSESVRRAGYAPDNADVEAARLLANPSICDYLQTLTQPATDKRIARAIEQQIFLTSVMRNTDEKTDVRIKACETLGKMQGNYKDRLELSGSVSMPISIVIEGV